MSDEFLKIYAAGGGGDDAEPARYPVNDPEGAYYRKDRDGLAIQTGALSVTETEILDLMCEGEIEGLSTGDFLFYDSNEGDIGYTSMRPQPYPEPPGLTNARWLRSIFWNKVPLVDSNNQFNFATIDVNFSKGTPNGTDIATDSELTITKPYGEALLAPYKDSAGVLVGDTDDYIKVYRIFNRACVAIKVNVRFGPFFKNNTTEEEYGDIEQTSVEYTIEYRPIFSDGQSGGWSTPYKEKLTGKLSSPYLLSTRIDFEQNSFRSRRTFAGWEVRIIKLTPDSIFSELQNKTYIDSITEVYGNKYTFPNSALVRSKFDAKYFTQIPERAFDVKMLKILVPSNYDPIKHSYTGDWDGTFSATKKFSRNPAWCFYDLITNKRYGLGNYVGEDYFDKWTLYKIAQYCDTLVPDGKGGLEPRFCCDLLINNKEEAFKVLNDFASIFRSIIYYGGGSLFLSQDSAMQPEDAMMQFTNADVENGNFSYNSAPRASRNTVAIVRYSDPNNFYRPAVEMVQDIELIKKYGRREFEMTSFGNKSRGQAIREGRYALYTQNYQNETVSFSAGPQAAILRPGDLIKISDQYRNYNRLGGRIFSGVSGQIFHLDSNLTGYFRGKENFNFDFTLTTPTYTYDSTEITDLTAADIPNIRKIQKQIKTFNLSNVSTDSVSEKTKLTFPATFTTNGFEMVDNAVWSIDCTGDYLNTSEYWKVINVQEKEFKYEVLGLKFDFNKFGYVESGIKFQSTAVNTDWYDRSVRNLLINVEEYHTDHAILRFTVPNLTWRNFGSELPDTVTTTVTEQERTIIVIYKTGLDFTTEDFTTTTSYTTIAVLPPGQSEGTFSITDNANYFFRAYVANPDGTLSDNYTSFTTGINFLQSVGEIIISSLSVDGNQAAVLAGDATIALYTGANPTYTWRVGYDNNNTYPGSIFYRMTIREPSETTAPNPNIYYEDKDLTFAPGKPFAWTFLKDVNKNLTNPFVGPFRNYDVVIEAHDSAGNSSAGGNFLNNVNDIGMGDSDYTRGLGYDIIYAANSGIQDLYLTPDGEDQATSLTNGLFFTSQSIRSDGGVNINIKTGNYTLPDAIGGYLYYSDTTFTSDDITNEVPGIERVPFELKGINLFPAKLDIPVGLETSIQNKYIAYRLYDTYDKAMETPVNSLLLSNVLQIERDTLIYGANSRMAMFDPTAERGLASSNIAQNGSGIGMGVVPANGYFHVSGLLLRFDSNLTNSAADAGQYLRVNVSGTNYYLKLYT